MSNITDMHGWLEKRNKELDGDIRLHKLWLEEWKAMHSNSNTIYTLLAPDRTDAEFKELRDELDKQNIDYRVVSIWIDPRE